MAPPSGALVEPLPANATAGQVLTFYLTSDDTTPKNDLVQATLRTHRNGIQHTLHAHAIDNQDSTYTLTLLPVYAQPDAQIHVTVNGTEIPGSPFQINVKPGKTSARESFCYGTAVFDGTTASTAQFFILAKDAYGNLRRIGGDKFNARVRLFKCTSTEFEHILRRRETLPEAVVEILDQEDGTYMVIVSATISGIYSIMVTLDGAPLDGMPLRHCILSPSILLPLKLPLEPLKTEGMILQKTEHALPECAASDCAFVHTKIVVFESKLNPSSRWPSDYLHCLDCLGWGDESSKQWYRLNLRPSGPSPIPSRRVCVSVDHQLIFLCHTYEDSPIDDVRHVDLRKPTNNQIGIKHLNVEGTPPCCIEGYSAVLWEFRRSIIIYGGSGVGGGLSSKVHVLHLVGTEGTPSTWGSIDMIGPVPSPRQGQSLTPLILGSFLMFGGDSSGTRLNDLHLLDAASSTWSECEGSGTRPTPRSNHAACCVAGQYLIIYGGTDGAGKILGDLFVYDADNGSWTCIAGTRPRTHHWMSMRAGQLFVMGGHCATGQPSPVGALTTSCAEFKIRGAVDFSGADGYAISCPAEGPLSSLGHEFTVEAIFCVRSSNPGTITPIVLKSDDALKAGFGVFAIEHPCFKGDAEAGLFIHFWYGLLNLSSAEQVKAKIEQDVWYHVCGMSIDGELRLYINGGLNAQCELTALSSGEKQTLHSKGNVYIGGLPGKYMFDGQIEMVRLWNLARSEIAIRNCMNDLMVPKAPDDPLSPDREELTEGEEEIKEHLVAQWSFNEGAGFDFLDSSGNGCHGILPIDTSEDCQTLKPQIPRRVKSRRGEFEFRMNISEMNIDSNYTQLFKYEEQFMEANQRGITKAELMLSGPDVQHLAKDFGKI